MNHKEGNPPPTRAQSAPPQAGEQGCPRFVSKIEIQPGVNQENNIENQAPQGQQPQAHNNNNQQQHATQYQQEATKPHVKQPNVRHIPIFVEGRDTPIVNRDHESSSFHQEPHGAQFDHHAPQYEAHGPQYSSPRYREPIFEPVYTASSNVPLDRPFGGHPAGPGSMGGAGGYRAPQTTQLGGSSFSKPSQRPSQGEKVHRVFTEPSHQGRPQPGGPAHTGIPPQAPSHAGPAHDAPDGATASHAPSPPPKKISRPRTPLEMIQEVQAEVDKLKEEIEKFKGTTRKDKEYIYLDEMLTRELLKLDNVDSGGNEEIRNLRRATIKNIQATIAFLESKVPSTPSGDSKKPADASAASGDSAQPCDASNNSAGDQKQKEGEQMEVEDKGQSGETGASSQGEVSQVDTTSGGDKTGAGDTTGPPATQ